MELTFGQNLSLLKYFRWLIYIYRFPEGKLSKTIFAVLAMGILIGCGPAKSKHEHNEWDVLFNGKNLKGWTVKIHHYDVGENYADTFRVEDGIIKVRYDRYEGDFNERFAHLYYDKPFSNFHLSMEYRFIDEEPYKGSPDYVLKNSGVMYHSQDPHTMPREQDWPISVEMQFLAGIEEGVARPTGNMCSPGTDVVYEGKIDPRHCIPSTSKTYYGEQWVKADLIVYGDSLIIHKINGETVLQYSKPQIGGGVANRYNPDIWEEGKPLKQGFIALQGEGQPVDFKNIKIKELKP